MLDRWLRIELRHLFALEAVAQERSFSAAGHRLGYVQSAVSHQIAALEAIVGTRLIERSRGTRPVALTADGEVLFEHAKTILARVRAAEADLDGNPARAELRVGSFQAFSSRIVPRVLRRLRAVRVELVEHTTDVGLLDRLADGSIDVAFSEGPLPGGPFDAVTLFEDPYVVLAPADSPFAEAPTLTLRDVALLPLVGHSSDRPRLRRHFDVRGLHAEYVIRSDANTTIQALVRAGAGYAVVPRFSVDARDDEVAVIQLDPPDAVEPRVALLVWNSDRERADDVDVFVDATLSVCEELGLVDNGMASLDKRAT